MGIPGGWKKNISAWQKIFVDWTGPQSAGCCVSMLCLLIIASLEEKHALCFKALLHYSLVFSRTYTIFCNFYANTYKLRRTIFFSLRRLLFMAVWWGKRLIWFKNKRWFSVWLPKKKKVFKRILHGTERDKGFYCAANLSCWVSSCTDRGPSPKQKRLCTDGSNLCHLIKTHWIKGKVIIYSAGLTNATFPL